VNQYHTGSNRVACALLMKYFQREGRFLRRKQDIPRVIVEYIADQLYLTPAAFGSYKWEREIIDRHRSRIRRFLSVRTGITADANSVLAALVDARQRAGQERGSSSGSHGQLCRGCAEGAFG
jgi:Domain of unknown function (DUF4158)